MKLISFSALLFGLVSAAPAFADDVFVSRTGEWLKAKKPIEAYVSPKTLFQQDDPNLPLSKVYRPLSAFDKPWGTEIGQVVISKPECFTPLPENGVQPVERPECADAGKHTYVPKTGGQHDLLVGEYSYEVSGLVTHLTIRPGDDEHIWAEIEYDGGKFWVNAPEMDVHYFEDLASFITKPAVWCKEPGKCANVSAKMKTEMDVLVPVPNEKGQYKAGQQPWVVGCNMEVYLVRGKTTVKGQSYYYVSLAELAKGAPKVDALPTSGYVPTRDKAGRHVGYFFSRGC
jgi:hypothetical protein